MAQNSVTKRVSIDPYIIAIGASAGGLEALKLFFNNLPKNSRNSYIVIQHLSPDYKSMMAELLAKSTSLKIKKIEDNCEILPGHIYLIPPTNNLILEEGRLRLLEKPKNQKLNLLIDIFLESLAPYKKEKAIAVILSGTGSDGTNGIKAIKENNGVVIVQEPTQAKFDGMPKSAIRTGLVDYILPVEDMGDEIKSFIKASQSLFLSKDTAVSYNKAIMSSILQLVDQKVGLDFTEYKYSTLSRRLLRRIHVCKCKSFDDYFTLLQSDEKEINALAREFLIGVTKFFRDTEVWEVLKTQVIPDLVAKIAEGETLKIWDVACSTGEEAYTLAILIQEELESQEKNIEVKIFATDIAEDHLNIGSNAIYSESIVGDIEPFLLQKYFSSISGGYQVIEKLRKMVVFSKHNIIKNPPFSNMNMVLCRNLLIYFQPSIQKKALNVLHYALEEDGVLVLGTSESIQTHRENFDAINRKWKIFRNISPVRRLKTETLKTSTNQLHPLKRQRIQERPTKMNTRRRRFLENFNQTVLDHFGSASVFIDADYNILKAIGEFRKYANLPTQGFSINLLDMLGEELKPIILSSVRKAAKTNQEVVYKNAFYRENEEKKALNIFVKPFRENDIDTELHFTVTLIERKVDYSKFDKAFTLTTTSRHKDYIQELEQELSKTKEELKTSLEEIETSNEELQAANEELLASNEELQSTNEELQSVNEEINTVNAENVQKMEDLAELNADMNNLLESTEIGTIFLDKGLRIRKFTPAIQKHFSLIASDVGRPIDNFTNSFGVHRRNTLINRCKKVLKTGKTLQRNIVSREGKNYLQRISAFINSHDIAEGIVITFVDIESLQDAKDKLVASEKRFKSFYEEDPVMHFSVDPKTSKIVQCNLEAIERLGYESKEEIIGSNMFDLYEDEAQLKALKLGKVFQEKGELKNVELEMLTKDGHIIPIMMSSTVELDEHGNGISNRFTCVDVSELKEAQLSLSKQKADLERANKDLEQFVSICSHDLQEPLATIKFGSDILGKIYGDRLDEKGREYISYIDQASDRLSQQIKALLEHSRIGRGTKKQLVDTQEIVEIVKYDLGKRIKDTKAKIYAGNLPKIKGYEVELRLLFQNLISNSLKYKAKDKEPEIRISAFKQDNYYIFSIMDNGIGISKEDQKNIFTIFNRVPTKEKYEGTGVGLAHVEKIVALHKGSLWVESQVGVGSTFYFKLKSK
ncbi:chemotaxis protein CheB [Mesonia ostreae]|uniref:Chemotaxis protein CheB n=1 Tax=Mesonia ostreae TaxID=861110 RepID=A0ABU2KL51_9FLAO|nr:chemotaxis protein CheB [Mesonia ostreae]MDT0295414.1 chemotaxis protein CheB [Mesonia ostreae]